MRSVNKEEEVVICNEKINKTIRFSVFVAVKMWTVFFLLQGIYNLHLQGTPPHSVITQKITIFYNNFPIKYSNGPLPWKAQ